MKISIIIFILFAIILVGLFAFFPVENRGKNYIISAKNANKINDLSIEGLDGYLRNSEKKVAKKRGVIKQGAEKNIFWYKKIPKKTKYSIIYVHGFSASQQEASPLPHRLAESLAANIFFTRLAGHGFENDENLKFARARKWYEDIDEALAIGEKIGEEIILLGTSTGGTLATLALHQQSKQNKKPLQQQSKQNKKSLQQQSKQNKSLQQQSKQNPKIKAVVLFSPNYDLAIKGSAQLLPFLLNMPFARQIVSLVRGEKFDFPAINEQHKKWWSLQYPTSAVLPMQAVVEKSKAMDFSKITTPVFFIFHEQDGVVDSQAIIRASENWGGRVKIYNPKNTLHPQNHVIVGDVFAAGNTQNLHQQILTWIRSL